MGSNRLTAVCTNFKLLAIPLANTSVSCCKSSVSTWNSQQVHLCQRWSNLLSAGVSSWHSYLMEMLVFRCAAFRRLTTTVPSPWRHTLWAAAPWPGRWHFWRQSPICYPVSDFAISAVTWWWERKVIWTSVGFRDSWERGLCLWSSLPSTHPLGVLIKLQPERITPV